MSDRMDLSLDDIIARDGFSTAAPVSGNRVAVKQDTKVKGKYDNIVLTVSNGPTGPLSGTMKRKNPFIDQSLSAATAANVGSDGVTNKGHHFDTNNGQIFIENLKYEVIDEDIRQLFEAFGGLKRAAINYEKTGRSAGTAFIVFERKADAVTAMASLQGVTLDGRVLRLTLIDSNGNANGQRMANLNSRLKSAPKQPSSGSGRDMWSDLAARDDGDSHYQKQGNKRFQRDAKEVVSVDDLDADLESYLSQRNK